MTGAKVPASCDAVLQHELTEQIDSLSIKILRPVAVGANLRRAGTDIRKGDVVLQRGHCLRPPDLGVLASLGRQFVPIYRNPEIAVLATGSELVPIDRTPPPGMIRNSNIYAIRGMIAELGAHALDLGIAKDERAELCSRLEEGLRADMLITIGGVSAGKYDLVIEELKALGLEVVFWKVNIRPGMPLLFGMYNGRVPVFGLPGNPVSSSVTFMQFVRPAIERMSGLDTAGRIRLRAALLEEFAKQDGKRHYVRGILDDRNGRLSVRTTGSQVSNVMTSLARANCLIVIPEECRVIHTGEEVEVELL
jgi:molybdopterin molybdotransferase